MGVPLRIVTVVCAFSSVLHDAGGTRSGVWIAAKPGLGERIIRLDPSARAHRPQAELHRGSLEVLQERIDVDVGQILGLVRSVGGFQRAVGKSGIPFQDQFLYPRWRPRGARLPQAAVLQNRSYVFSHPATCFELEILKSLLGYL